MKFPALLTVVVLSITATSVFAGDFVDLPTSGMLRVFGNNKQATDPMYLEDLPQGWTEVASAVTSLDWSTVDVKNLDGDAFTYGYFQDKVFRNEGDNTLMFASRLTLNIDLNNNQGQFSDVTDAYMHLWYNEANYIWRSGFSGFNTAAAWYTEVDGGSVDFMVNDPAIGSYMDTYNFSGDFRLKVAVMSSDKFSQIGATTASLNPTYSSDVVGFATDVSVPEGNPNGGWYLVKTNATNYTTLNNAVRILQDGGNGEGRPTRNFYLTGFSPTAVPEPSESMLMLLGFITIGCVIQRCRIYAV